MPGTLAQKAGAKPIKDVFSFSNGRVNSRYLIDQGYGDTDYTIKSAKGGDDVTLTAHWDDDRLGPATLTVRATGTGDIRFTLTRTVDGMRSWTDKKPIRE